mgnify:CR=1 FL=1
MSTTIILTRHGQTNGNIKKLWNGWTHDTLTPLGETQAHALGKHLQNAPISKIYSSDLNRAIQTAQIIQSYLDPNIPIEHNKHLREFHYGEAEQMSHADFNKTYTHIIQAWERNEDPRFPEGENCVDVAKRGLAALSTIALSHTKETILIVSHGGFNNVILNKLKNNTTIDFSNQANCCINILEYNQGFFTILRENDITHLQEINQKAF